MLHSSLRLHNADMRSSRPFWLNPRQIIVIPVASKYGEYAEKVAQSFRDAGMFADVDESANTLNKMIRNAQIGQWSFVMGESRHS